jgi:hypothetical protein
VVDDVLVAAGVGAIAQLVVRGKLGLLVAFILGVAAFAVPFVYRAYFGPYVGGGASMWPLAVLFSGPIFGCVAAVAALIVAIFRGDLRTVKHNVP